MYDTDHQIAFLLISTIWIMITLIAGIIIYLVTVYPLYKMYKNAGLKSPKFAFIPFINGLKLYNLANLSAWLVLISLIPVIGVFLTGILSCYVSFKIAENFGLGTLGCILAIFFPIFVYWYIALTNKPFIGRIDAKYLDNQYSM